MVWKPKVKELTKEEAIELAKKDLAPRWIGTEPLVAAIPSPGGKFTAYPLDPSFLEKSWLICFLDPTDFAGNEALDVWRHFNRRYKGYNLTFLTVFSTPYQHSADASQLSQLSKKYFLSPLIAFDPDGSLRSSFGIAPLPRMLLLHRGKVLLDRSGTDFTHEAERRVQEFLRETDPGLPLRPAVETKAFKLDPIRIELGKNRGVRLVTQRPPGSIEPGVVYTEGKWEQETECLVTMDPAARLTFTTRLGSRVAIIAENRSIHRDPINAVMELVGTNLYDAIVSEGVTLNEEGHGAFRVDRPQLTPLLQGIPAGKSFEVRVRFPASELRPVAVYGIRIGS